MIKYQKMLKNRKSESYHYINNQCSTECSNQNMIKISKITSKIGKVRVNYMLKINKKPYFLLKSENIIKNYHSEIYTNTCFDNKVRVRRFFEFKDDNFLLNN